MAKRTTPSRREDSPKASSRPLPAWESPGFLLWHATLRWQRRIAATLRPLGLTHVQFVLLASVWWLATQGRQPSQRELADHAGTNVMMTSQVLRSLEARALVDRQPDPTDARSLRLVVTAQGEELARRAVRAVEATDHEYFSAIEDQRELLLSLRAMAGRSPSGAALDGPTTRSRRSGR